MCASAGINGQSGQLQCTHAVLSTEKDGRKAIADDTKSLSVRPCLNDWTTWFLSCD